jgi:hypothetical protein
MEKITAAEYLALKKKKNKYGNKRCEYNGIKFQSKKEMERWKELILLQFCNEISDLKRQERFEIMPRYENQRPTYYVADFVYFDNKSENCIIEDVKSEATRKNKVYILKKKLMKLYWGIDIVEI